MSKHHIFFLTDLILGLTALAMIITGCQEESGRQASPVPPTEITAPLDSIFGELFPQEEPGALVMVMKGDSIMYDQGFGVADLATGELVSDSTLFNIATASKQFTALAMLKLQEQGKLNLDDSLSKYFPNWEAPFYKDITIRQVLSHTSGLPDLRPRNEREWRNYTSLHRARFSRLKDYSKYALVFESLQLFANLDTLAFTPGTAYEYQNPPYQLMALIIEKVNPGVSFEEWMQQNIFDVAGMDNTQYFNTINPFYHEAHAYRRPIQDSDPDKFFRTPSGVWEEFDYGEAYFFPTRADVGLYTSGRELMRWNKALKSGAVLSDSLRNLAQTPVIETDSAGIFYGMGYYIDQRPGKPHKLYQTGSNGGFTIYQANLPEDDVTYIIMATHRRWDRDEVAAKVDSVLISKGWVNN